MAKISTPRWEGGKVEATFDGENERDRAVKNHYKMQLIE